MTVMFQRRCTRDITLGIDPGPLKRALTYFLPKNLAVAWPSCWVLPHKPELIGKKPTSFARVASLMNAGWHKRLIFWRWWVLEFFPVHIIKYFVSFPKIYSNQCRSRSYKVIHPIQRYTAELGLTDRYVSSSARAMRKKSSSNKYSETTGLVQWSMSTMLQRMQ